ncbi:MAG: methyltransferase family protein [Candidatus Thorarchaeota archaeon]
MVDFEEFKKRHPRAKIALQGLWIIILSTIFTYVIFAPFLIFNVDIQILIDIFTFPADIIPQPYNLIGILFIPIGMLLIIWANYSLLYVGRITLGNREPMQRPEALVLVGPYRFSRNPLYLGCLMALFGLAIVLSSVVTAVLFVLTYIVFRYVFIKREETILEEEFGDEYREFKRRVRRRI